MSFLHSFGDSIAAGYPFGTSVCYAARAATALGRTHVQYAVNGSKIADVAAAIAAITPSTADIYTIGVGLNDARDNGVGTNGVYAFYQSLLGSVQHLVMNNPAHVFLFTPSLQTLGGTAGFTACGGTPEATASFADAVRCVAFETGVQLIDAYALIGPSDLVDGGHWFDTAHYQMGSRVALRAG